MTNYTYTNYEIAEIAYALAEDNNTPVFRDKNILIVKCLMQEGNAVGRPTQD